MKISEVQQLVRMLEQAESYLAERGLTGQYSKVYKQGKYAFRQLLKCRQSLGGEPERDVFTNLSYLLIDDPEGGRLYESIPELNQNLSGIIGRIRTELNPGGGNLAALVPNPNTTVELFGSTGQAHANYADILEVLRDSNQRDRVRTVVQDALEEIDRREREKRDAEYCLRQVVHAHTDLQAAFNALDETTQTAGMDSQLGNIEILLNRIREWLRSRDNT
jgi:hypothetical protein